MIDMIEILKKRRRAIFYFLVVLIILVSSISVLWLPPEVSTGMNSTGSQNITEQESGLSSLPLYIPLFAYFVLILLPVIYKRYDGESFVWGHRFFKGAILGFILITMIFLIELASGFLRIEDLLPDFQGILIAGIILQGIVAFGEELPFRGYILPDMQKRFGLWKAVILSSFFFSLLHIPSILVLKTSGASIIIMVLTLTFAEMLLAFCYLYDGLRMSIGFHFAWNFFQYHVYSMREGFGGIFKITSGYQLVTGGNLGPEAGLLGLFVVVMALVIVFIWMGSINQESQQTQV
jgi:membrane protease YdiL (CAAX protease family)